MDPDVVTAAAGSASAPANAGPLTGDAMTTALLQALQGTGTHDPMVLLRSQVELQARDNPKAALLLQLLQQRLSPPSVETAPTEPEDAEDGREPTATPEPPAEGALESLESTLDDVFRELELLRARNRRLSAALGACDLCLGDDPLCRRCTGRGQAGWSAPHPRHFRSYVLPALRRAQAVEHDSRKHELGNARPSTRNER